MFEPPGIRADSPEGKRDEVILKCRAKGKSFIISLVYNMILITTCTIYAVKTRKIPENFNESKFIGFTMYTTIVIWLAFVTMFFGTNNSYEVRVPINRSVGRSITCDDRATPTASAAIRDSHANRQILVPPRIPGFLFIRIRPPVFHLTTTASHLPERANELIHTSVMIDADGRTRADILSGLA